jgi:uncharacterized phage protein gp47/JayE
MPLATVACTVDPNGISAPSFAAILQSFIDSTKNVYGSDIYLDPSTKDGALLAVLAQAQSDSNQQTIATYNGYNPQNAVGTNLDAAVQPNGIQRQASSASTVILAIGGTVGTLIPAGIVQDLTGNLWNLPANITIPVAGTINVTATAQQQGNIVALPGTVTIPYTVVLGWQTVTNVAAAVPGAPVELDGALRARQSVSTALTGYTSLAAIESNVANTPGVSRSKVYQNDTGEPDINGVPAHSIAVVALGGDILAVATAIQQKKDLGAGTYGTISQIVIDPSGMPININFFELELVRIYQAITIKALTGYTADIGVKVAAAAAAFVSGLDIGETVYLEWCKAAATLSGLDQQTFVVTAMTQATTPAPVATADIVIAFSSAAQLAVADVTLTVT